MTERSQRRAASRKAAKRAKKHSSQIAQNIQPQAPVAAAQGSIHDDIPPSPLLLDSLEESNVEVSDFHTRRLERVGAEFAAPPAARDAVRAAAESTPLEPKPSETKKEISDAQLAANRANAQHSTGPTSSAGRETSSRNNFRHGLTHTEGDLLLLPDESKDDYSKALADFQKEWKPVTATEHDLVERLASRQWLRRRAMRLQLRYMDDKGYVIDYQQHALYRRYEMTHERSFNKALADLMRLRSIQLREQNGFESQRRKNAEHEFKIRRLQHREKLQELAIRIADAKLNRIQTRKPAATLQKQPPKPPRP